MPKPNGKYFPNLSSNKYRIRKLVGKETKKSCHWQDPFQNINPNITLEIKSFRLILKNSDKILPTAYNLGKNH